MPQIGCRHHGGVHLFSPQLLVHVAGRLAGQFSRIYNGLHYPSDVLAGAILGAGYAAATIWCLEALWQWPAKMVSTLVAGVSIAASSAKSDVEVEQAFPWHKDVSLPNPAPQALRLLPSRIRM